MLEYLHSPNSWVYWYDDNGYQIRCCFSWNEI